MKVDVVDMPAKRLVAVRHHGPNFLIGAAFDELFRRTAGLELHRDADPITVAVYLDDPESKPADQMESLAAISVAEDASIDGLEEARLPSGRFLRAQFIGHYAGLGDGWGRLYSEYIPGGGHTLRDGVCFEVYVSDHDTTPPDELQTDLYAPIV